MSASMSLTNLLESLPNSTDKKEILEEVKTVLMSLKPSDLREVIGNTSFNVIFETIDNDQDRPRFLSSHLLKLCIEVLDHILSSHDAVGLMENFRAEILHGLQNGDDMIRGLCLKQIKRVAESAPEQLGMHEDIVYGVIKLLALDISLAQVACTILVYIGSTNGGAQFLYTGQSLEQFKSLMEKNDTIRYRVYEVMVNVANQSLGNLELCLTCGMLVQLTNEIFKDDILIQLNCLEMLTKLASSAHGLQYLDQQGIVNKMEEMLVDVETNPLAGFLLPGLIKFFGNVAHHNPKEICGKFTHFINTVFNLVQSHDQALMIVAIETIGYIGDTVEGKRALEKQGQKMKQACKHIGTAIQNTPTEMRVRSLTSMSALLHLQLEEQTNDVLQLTENWFNNLHTRPMDMLMSLVEQPFTELRSAAMELIRMIANQPWGQSTLNNHPGFCEYLLDRSTEKTKEGKEGKCDIVKTLVESPTAQEIFGNVYFVRLREYMNEGPFYTRVEAAIASENME